MPCRVARLFAATLLLTCAAAAAAQDVSRRRRRTSHTWTAARSLERDGQPDAAPENMPMLAGDRVRTQAGRVEILFADGSTLHLDAHTIVDFQSDELVRLLDGRVRLSIPGAGPPGRIYRIDAPAASVQYRRAGRVSRVPGPRRSREPEVELLVLRGAAELVNDQGRTPLRAGERAVRSQRTPRRRYAYVFNSAAWDAFDRWSEARRDQRLARLDPVPARGGAPVRDVVRRYGRLADTNRRTGTCGIRACRRGGGRTETVAGSAFVRTGWTWVGAAIVGLADAPLRTLGLLGRCLVLDSRAKWAPAWVSWATRPDT